MKNAQKPEKIHLGKLINEINKGRFVIPDFQREFAWEPWDVSDLIKSIFMDYYIGTLLLWESSEKNFDALSCEGLYAFENKLDPEYIVLDGQQRLTAMHYAFFQPTKAFPNRKNPVYYFIRLKQLLEEEYEEAFFYHSATKAYKALVEDKEKQFEQHIFPLGVMKDGSWEIEDWIKSYRNYWQDKSEAASDEKTKLAYEAYAKSAKVLKEIFSELLDNYHISYIALNRDIEVGKVCDIFTHINSKGVKLDIFDLLNAMTRPKGIFLKNKYREASKALQEYYPKLSFKTSILMVMSILEQKYCSPKYLYYLVPGVEKTIKKADGEKEKITLIDSAEGFNKKWDFAVKAVDKALKILKNPRDYGAINHNFLPYPSLIPVFAAVHSYINTEDLKNKVDIHSKIKKWYWASIFENNYSSSVESTSTKDFMDLQKWFEDDQQEPESLVAFKNNYKHLDLLHQNQSGAAIYKAIFNLFILNEARDWETFELPEYEALDDHHIVPKSWGKKEGIGKDINSILNKAPISVNTNRNIISNKLPNVYLRTIFDSNADQERVYQVLASHLISKKAIDILLRTPFTKDDYYAFLNERKNTIIQAIKHKCLEEHVEIPEDLKILDAQIEQVELNLRSLIQKTLTIETLEVFRTTIPSHLLPKLKGRIDKEVRKNPTLAERRDSDVDFWFQFLDLQELKDIIINKQNWQSLGTIFLNKEKLMAEFKDMGDLRNCIRHSREADKITRMKGEAATLWFIQQMEG